MSVPRTRKPRLVRFGSATFSPSTDLITCEQCGAEEKVVFPTTMKSIAEMMQAFDDEHYCCVEPTEGGG